MKEIREREREQQGIIWALCARLGNIRPDELVEAIDHLPSQKRMEELEAKISFLQEKSKKANEELKEEKGRPRPKLAGAKHDPKFKVRATEPLHSTPSLF